MSSLFNSRFPILSAPMNKVSNAELAIAVHNAGAFPSISAYNFRFNGRIDYQKLRTELLKFKQKTNSSDLLLSIGADEMLTDEIISYYKEGLISHLELICESIKLKGVLLDSLQIEYFQNLKNKIDPLKDQGIVIVFKSLTRFLIKELYNNFKNSLFDGYVIKGPDAAGSVVDVNKSRLLEHDITQLLLEYPDLKLIASGGIASPNDVKKFIELGVDSVAVGTILAMSTESIVSLETKNAVLERKNQSLDKFINSNQRAMIFSKIENDDYNHTASLVKGITSPLEGHIFLGMGITQVSEIKSVNEIIKILSKDL
jgi:NAD(P)H-dependent flavin oxidoreductase YrpB (nitropropane dioxygenase family)